MIDTDKYEGHAQGPWEWDGAILTVEGKISTIIEMFALTLDEGWVKSENLRLIADAPLLLAEVKRLREKLRLTKEWLDQLESPLLEEVIKYVEMIE